MSNWSRTVWAEPQSSGKLQEFEMMIPYNWVKDGLVYWPNHLNVIDSFNQQEEPKLDWKVFKLIKLKLEKGICNIHFSICVSEIKSLK